MSESKLTVGSAPVTDKQGRCTEIRDTALSVVEGLGATVGLLAEALEEVCDGNCAVCPVEIMRSGKRAVMNPVHTTIYGITTGWQALISAVSPCPNLDS